MKKYYLPLLVLTLSASTVSARQLSESAALEIATAKVPTLAKNAKRVHAAGIADVQENAPLYFFSSPAGGFAIVAGDDRMPAPVIAYSHSGTLDLTNCPPAMLEWLDGMSALISAGNFSAIPRSSLDYSTPVGPMVTTKWNQDAPYNLLTPGLGDKAHCPTGCVATAMAQVVNYWKYPSEGGLCEHSYTWNGQTLSVDFRESRYDWTNMKDIYDASSTEAENAAVAKLMYDCGVACSMAYGEEESASNDYKAAAGLVDFLGYSKETRLRMRMTVLDDEWFELVKSELDAGHPLIYMGSTVNNEGHAFVCDGYDSEGLYHINWGWGGKCDGYFDLNTLDPDSQGIGGAASGEGFTTSQSIMTGCRPPQPDDEEAPGWEMCVCRFYVIPEDAEGSTFTITPLFGNLGYRDFAGRVVVYLNMQGEDPEESEVLADFTGSNAMQPGAIMGASIADLEAAELSDGVYELTFAVVPESEPDIEVEISPVVECESTTFEIKDGKLVFDPRPILVFNNIKITPIDYFNVHDGVRCVFANVSADITNESGITYNNGYSVTVEFDNGVFMPTSRVTTDFYMANPIGPGETVEMELPIFFNASSKANFEITECVNPDGAGAQNVLFSGNIFSAFPEVVYHELTAAGDPEVCEADGKVTVSVPMQSSFGGNSKGIDEEMELTREVTCSIYDAASDSLEPVATATATYQGKWQEAKTLVLEPETVLPAGSYIAQCTYTSAPFGFGQTSELRLGEDMGYEGTPFEIKSSAISEIGADPRMQNAVIYNLHGLPMKDAEALAPGVYIRKTGNRTEKFTIK